MKILAIDPGETIGVACLASTETTPAALWSWGSVPVVDGFRNLVWSTIRETLLGSFQINLPDVVVLEDYRVYKSAAKAHIGSRVLTAELIGAICYQSFQLGVGVVRVAASKKGKWPEARLKSKFPSYFRAQTEHERDAILLALIYIEEVLGRHLPCSSTS